MKAKIIEDRGCNIRYEVYTGTVDECFNQLDIIEAEIASGERRNGNNDPHDYDVIPESWDIKDAFTEASSNIDWDNEIEFPDCSPAGERI